MINGIKSRGWLNRVHTSSEEAEREGFRGDAQKETNRSTSAAAVPLQLFFLKGVI